MANVANLNVPMKTVTAEGGFVSSTGMKVPFKTAYGTSEVPNSGILLKRRPFPTLISSAEGGRFTRPFQTLEGAGTSTLVGLAQGSIPFKKLASETLIPIWGDSSLTIPKKTFFGNVFIPLILNAGFQRPFQKVSATGDPGLSVGYLSSVVPVKSIDIAGVILNVVGGANLIRPFMFIDSYGSITQDIANAVLLVMNTSNRAMTYYSDYQMGEMAVLDGKSYGVGQDGLYELDGDNDGIYGKIEFPEIDLFRKGRAMRPKYVYLNCEGNNAILTYNDYEYPIEEYGEDARVPLGKGFKDRLGNLSISSLRELELRTLTLDCYIVASKRR